jgi:hypothetical protein
MTLSTGNAGMAKLAGNASTGLFLALVAALGATPPAAAQDYRFAAGWNVGGAWFSPLNGGASAQADDLKFDPGWIIGLQFEEWLGSGRLGLRANGALSERSLTTPDEERDIGIWFLDADLLFRFLPADADRRVNVFLSAGAGMARYALGRGSSVVWESADASYNGEPGVKLAAAGGLGVDYLTSLTWDGEPIGIRFEVVDHVVLTSPFASISGGDFDPIHNVRFVIGAFTGFGLRR